MDWPNVSVLIPTYNRAKTVAAAIRCLDEHLTYAGSVSYHVGIDGNDNTVEMLESMARDSIADCYRNIHIHMGPRCRDAEEQGLGANLNMLMQKTPDDFLIQMDDDHHLRKDLNLNSYVKHLMSHEEAGWIRLMGIGSHSFTATLKGAYWYIHWNSSGDFSLYIPSNRPHIKHRRFHDFFGLYPVNRKLGETEEAFCHQCRNKVNAMLKAEFSGVIPSVVVPLNSNSETAWGHVGKSWQLQGE